MARHPLDISSILKARGVPLEDSTKNSGDARMGQHGAMSSHPLPERSRIRPEIWASLSPECRRFLTKKTWQGVDFNPFLSALEDLGRITEEWLRWAVPAYVGGLAGGPIRDWKEGRLQQSLHELLVAEHQRFKKARHQESCGVDMDRTLLLVLAQQAEALRISEQKIEAHAFWLEGFLRKSA